MLVITSNHVGYILRNIDSMVERIHNSSVRQTRATAANKCVMNRHKITILMERLPSLI
jgi:ATP-dependent protease HslVU (ClpYQ) ATPase subunit